MPPLLIAALAGAAAIGASTGWALVERSGRLAARAEAAQLVARVGERDAALRELAARHERQVAALESLARDTAARTAEMRAIRREVDRAPPTAACAAAPAVRAALDGLRTRAAARGAGGAPGPATEPAGVRPGAAAAR